MKNFTFEIDLDEFEEVLSDEQTAEAFYLRQGKELLALMAKFEEVINGVRRFEPMPSVGTIRAAQFSFFDNGPIGPRGNGSKKPLRQKTQYAGNLKVWTRPGNINFGKKSQVAWEATTYLWSEADTLVHLTDLRTERRISESTVENMREFISIVKQEADPKGLTCLFSIPLRIAKPAGQKYMSEHLFCVMMQGTAPQSLAFFHPEAKGFMSEQFSTSDCSGESFANRRQAALKTGKRNPTTHQCRIAFEHRFTPWATDTQARDKGDLE